MKIEIKNPFDLDAEVVLSDDLMQASDDELTEALEQSIKLLQRALLIYSAGDTHLSH
jgi:hypothetical protein